MQYSYYSYYYYCCCYDYYYYCCCCYDYYYYYYYYYYWGYFMCIGIYLVINYDSLAVVLNLVPGTTCNANIGMMFQHMFCTHVIKHIKGSKERYFLGQNTYNMRIFGVIPFIKLENDT